MVKVCVNCNGKLIYPRVQGTTEQQMSNCMQMRRNKECPHGNAKRLVRGSERKEMLMLEQAVLERRDVIPIEDSFMVERMNTLINGEKGNR